MGFGGLKIGFRIWGDEVKGLEARTYGLGIWGLGIQNISTLISRKYFVFVVKYSPIKRRDSLIPRKMFPR